MGGIAPISVANESWHPTAHDDHFQVKFNYPDGRVWLIVALFDNKTQVSFSSNVETVDFVSSGLSEVYNLTSGFRKITVTDAALLMQRRSAQDGDVVEIFPYSLKAYWLDEGKSGFPRGILGYNVDGHMQFTRAGVTTSVTGDVQHLWGNIIGYINVVALLETWHISTNSFVVNINELIDTQGHYFQGGGILWLDNGEYENLGYSLLGSTGTIHFTFNNNCSKWSITIPTKRGTLVGNVSTIPFSGGYNCYYEFATVPAGTFSLGGTSFTVQGIVCETGYRPPIPQVPFQVP